MVSQALTRAFQRGMGNIQHGEVCITFCEKMVNQRGCAAANVNDRRIMRDASPANQIKRELWMCLIPTDLGWGFGLVNGFPMDFRLHRFHLAELYGLYMEFQ